METQNLRLSKLQMDILIVISYYTYDWQCGSSGRMYPTQDGLFSGELHSHDTFEDAGINYTKLLEETSRVYWDINGNIKNKHRVSFTNSIHNLVEEKGLVKAYALGWMLVGHIANRGYGEEFHYWQGGGKSKDGDLSGRPRYKILFLSRDGWRKVRKMTGEPSLGYCGETKEIIKYIINNKPDSVIEDLDKYNLGPECLHLYFEDELERIEEEGDENAAN